MALFIFRKDLRLNDNPALLAAVDSGLTVYPILIVDPDDNENVTKLALASVPEGTMVFTGNQNKVVSDILETGVVKEIYINENAGYPITFSSGKAKLCTYDNGTTLLPPGTVKTKAGGFFKKFTAFRTSFLEVYKGPKAEKVAVFTPGKLPAKLSYKIAKKSKVRDEGLALLKAAKQPDSKELMTSKNSQLSPYIALGIVSVNEVYRTFKKKKITELLDGLIWREFYYNIAVGFPEVLTKKKAFRKELDWWYKKTTDKPFVLWTQGKTGFPIVDACMREFNATGEIGNRGRMIVGSFLTKILLVDWRLGEMWFSKKLVDYDPVLNNGNWQWVAGCGVDVQQYVRFFSPTNQGLKRDPKGEYVKKWVPELKDVSVKEMYSDKQKTIVDFKKRRETVLALFAKL